MSLNIIGPLPNKSDAPSENVKKASGTLPKKSYAPSENVKKASRDLDDTKNQLVTTIGMVDKEGTTETVDKKTKT